MAAVRRAGCDSISCNTLIVAAADTELAFERLEMNVRGLCLHRPGNDLVHQTDHRGLARKVFQALGIVVGGRVMRFTGERGGSRPVHPDKADLESGIEFQRNRDLHRHDTAGRGGDGFDGEAIHRVGQSDLETVSFQLEWDCTGLAEEFSRKALWQHRDCGVNLRTGDSGSQQHGVGLGQVTLTDQAELHQHGIETLAAFLCDTPATIDAARVAIPALQK